MCTCQMYSLPHCTFRDVLSWMREHGLPNEDALALERAERAALGALGPWITAMEAVTDYMQQTADPRATRSADVVHMLTAVNALPSDTNERVLVLATVAVRRALSTARALVSED